VTYLRPEPRRASSFNFDNVLQSMRRKLPFGSADRKAFRNDHPGQLHLPDARVRARWRSSTSSNPHETWRGAAGRVLHDRWIEIASRGSAATHPVRQPAAARARADDWPTTPNARRRAVPLPDRLERAVGHRQPHPTSTSSRHAKFSGKRSPTSTRSAKGTWCPTSSSRRRGWTGPARLPRRRLPRGGVRGRSGWCCAVHRSWPRFGGGAPLLKKRDDISCARARHPRRAVPRPHRGSTTTPPRSGGSIAGRTSGHAYCVTWTCRRWATATRASRRDGKVTIRTATRWSRSAGAARLAQVIGDLLRGRVGRVAAGGAGAPSASTTARCALWTAVTRRGELERRERSGARSARGAARRLPVRGGRDPRRVAAGPQPPGLGARDEGHGHRAAHPPLAFHVHRHPAPLARGSEVLEVMPASASCP